MFLKWKNWVSIKRLFDIFFMSSLLIKKKPLFPLSSLRKRMWRYSDFKNIHKISDGTYSEVYSANHGEAAYVLKQCSYQSKHRFKKIKKEIFINQRLLGTAFVCRYKGCFHHDKCYWLVLEAGKCDL